MITKTSKQNLKLAAFLIVAFAAILTLASFVSAADTTPPVVAIMLSQDNNINVHNSNSYSLTIYAHLWNKEYQTSVTACQIDWGEGVGWESVGIGTPETWYLVGHTYTTNGTKTINYRCQNSVGLWSSGSVKHTNYDTIDIQLSAPAVGIMLSQDNNISAHNNNSYLLTIYAHLWNNHSWYPVSECQIDWGEGASWENVGIGTMANWYLVAHTYASQGLQTINYRCRVNLGPWSTGSAQHVNFDTINISTAGDTTPPSIQFVSPQNITYATNSISVNIAATGAQNVWWNNGTANLTYSGPATYDFANGSHTLYAYANDSAGNFNQTSITFSVNTSLADTTAPVITINSPNQANYNILTIPLNITATDNIAVDKVWYNINGGANTTYTTPTTLALADNQTYTLRAYANDTSGNLATASFTFNVNTSLADVTAPVITGITTNPAMPFVNNGSAQNININFSSSEYPITVAINLYTAGGSLNNTQTFSIANSGSLPLVYVLPANLADGAYTLNMTASDLSLNSASYAIGSLTVNKTSSGGRVVDDNKDKNHDNTVIIMRSLNQTKTTSSGTATISTGAIDLTSTRGKAGLLGNPLFWLIIAIIIGYLLFWHRFIQSANNQSS